MVSRKSVKTCDISNNDSEDKPLFHQINTMAKSLKFSRKDFKDESLSINVALT